MGVALDGVAHGRVVHDGQQLCEMVDEDPEVERLVAVVQLLEIDVLGEIRLLSMQLFVRPGGLAIEGEDSGRQATGQTECGPLRGGERNAPVRVGSNRAAGIAGDRRLTELRIRWP